jgi:hypothetical protein
MKSVKLAKISRSTAYIFLTLICGVSLAEARASVDVSTLLVDVTEGSL